MIPVEKHVKPTFEYLMCVPRMVNIVKVHLRANRVQVPYCVRVVPKSISKSQGGLG